MRDALTQVCVCADDTRAHLPPFRVTQKKAQRTRQPIKKLNVRPDKIEVAILFCFVFFFGGKQNPWDAKILNFFFFSNWKMMDWNENNNNTRERENDERLNMGQGFPTSVQNWRFISLTFVQEEEQ